MKKYIPTIISLTLLLCITACRSSKQEASSTPAPTGSPEQRLESLAQYYTETPITSYTVPATISLTKPSRAKVSGTLSVVPEKYIHYSARFLGFEVGTVMITPDSLYAKIKPGKMYVAESLDAVKNNLPVSLTQLQQLLAGRVVVPGYDSLDRSAISRARLSAGKDEWYVTPRLPGSIDMTYTLNNDNNIIRLNVKATENRNAAIAMSDYGTTQFGSMPSEWSCTLNMQGKEFGADISLNLSRLRAESPSDKSWTAPSGYKKVDVRAVIKALSTL